MAPSVRQMFELTGRNYIVTGGAQGIGLAITRAITEMGGNVAVLDLRATPEDEFGTLSQQFNVQTHYFQVDVSDEDSLKASFQSAVDSLGSLDGVVTAAGIGIDKPFVDQTWQEAEKIQKVNVLGTFLSAQLATKQLFNQGTRGSLVLISSIASHIGLPTYRMAAYNASKGGVRMLTTALATELAPRGVRVNSISPGFIATEATKVVREAKPESVAIMDTAPPIGRIGTPDDIVGAAVYLLSDAASYTTGTDIIITGGLHIGRSADYA